MYTRYLSDAPIWDASWSGTPRNVPGIVRAMGPVSITGGNDWIPRPIMTAQENKKRSIPSTDGMDLFYIIPVSSSRSSKKRLSRIKGFLRTTPMNKLMGR